jgi:hypothetical protein
MHSSPEEWLQRGKQLFSDQKYAEARSCFIRAGQPQLAEWSSACILQQTAQQQQRVGGRAAAAAKGAFKAAAEAFLKADKLAQAAECLEEAREWYQAGQLHRDRLQKLPQAAHCFVQASAWREAMECALCGLQQQLKHRAVPAATASTTSSTTRGEAVHAAAAWQVEQKRLLQVMVTCCLEDPAGLQLQCLDAMAAWPALAAAAAAGQDPTSAQDATLAAGSGMQDDGVPVASSMPGAAADDHGPMPAAAAAWLQEAREVQEQLLRKLLRVHQASGNEALLMDAVSRWPDVGQQRKLLERRGCWRQLVELEMRLGKTARAAQVRNGIMVVSLAVSTWCIARVAVTLLGSKICIVTVFLAQLQHVKQHQARRPCAVLVAGHQQQDFVNCSACV